MTDSPSSICTRCNAVSYETGRCSKCGSRLQTLRSAKIRGWVAFGAGVFLAVFMAVIWISIDRLFATRAVAPSDEATRFLGKINVAFALIVVAGILGTINGWIMAHSGRRNLTLIVALVIAFAAAVFIAAGASSGWQTG